MTTYNTGNPVGSATAKDLYDNAENLDVAINSQTAGEWTDRLGNARQTWKGIEDKAEIDIAASASAAAASASAAAAGYRDETLAARNDAQAAASAIGPVKFYDTKAQADAAIGTMANGDIIEVSQDETRAGARTRYKVQAGALVFVVNLDQLRQDLCAAAGTQLVGLPSSTSASEFQAALNLSSVHKLTLNPGQYSFDGQTFTLYNKNNNTLRGEYVLDLSGVEFLGSGTLIIDSCKRVRVKGLFAPNWDIDLRGCWWSAFEDCVYRRTYTGRQGTIFYDNYWNQWIGGVTQAIVIPEDAVGPNNRFLWLNHSMRGNAQQGFSGSETHAFHFLGNQNAQHWVFDGDISYHTEGVINAPPENTADIEIEFDVYWDSVLPEYTSRPNVRIKNRGHHANGGGTYMPLSMAMKTRVDVTRRDRILTNTPGSARNMVINGDFSEPMTTWQGGSQPFSTVSGAAITWAQGGLSGGYLQVSQANASGNAITAVARNKQYGGTYTVVWVVKNRDAGERTIRASISAPSGLNYVTAKINDTEPTVLTVSASNVPGGAGNLFSSLFADGAGFNIDVFYVGISAGIDAPLLLPQVNRREIRADLTSAGVTVPAGGFFVENFTVQGVAVGDRIDVSVGTGSVWPEARVIGANTVQVKYSSTSSVSFDTTGVGVFLCAVKRLLGA